MGILEWNKENNCPLSNQSSRANLYKQLQSCGPESSRVSWDTDDDQLKKEDLISINEEKCEVLGTYQEALKQAKNYN